eukprot:7385899-Prymnesium_polylepis.1
MSAPSVSATCGNTQRRPHIRREGWRERAQSAGSCWGAAEALPGGRGRGRGLQEGTEGPVETALAWSSGEGGGAGLNSAGVRPCNCGSSMAGPRGTSRRARRRRRCRPCPHAAVAQGSEQWLSDSTAVLVDSGLG